MSDKLSAEVRTQLERLLRARHLVTYGQASVALGFQETWLRRRLNGEVKLTLDDAALICSRLNRSLADVLRDAQKSAAAATVPSDGGGSSGTGGRAA